MPPGVSRFWRDLSSGSNLNYWFGYDSDFLFKFMLYTQRRQHEIFTFTTSALHEPFLVFTLPETYTASASALALHEAFAASFMHESL